MAVSDQPPSGGCVLKHVSQSPKSFFKYQPPSGGCVLKQAVRMAEAVKAVQPPSGGCVLKLQSLCVSYCEQHPAAFGRLCVETVLTVNS